MFEVSKTESMVCERPETAGIGLGLQILESHACVRLKSVHGCLEQTGVVRSEVEGGSLWPSHAVTAAALPQNLHDPRLATLVGLVQRANTLQRDPRPTSARGVLQERKEEIHGLQESAVHLHPSIELMPHNSFETSPVKGVKIYFKFAVIYA
ncbi:unnamed protein product [Cercospora beticola]|nr:unnamed protein product [Cercospora beticola]